jgi:hypothetical protein
MPLRDIFSPSQYEINISEALIDCWIVLQQLGTSIMGRQFDLQESEFKLFLAL